MTEFEITEAIRNGEALHLIGFGLAVKPLEVETDHFADAYVVLVETPEGEVWSVNGDELEPLATEDDPRPGSNGECNCSNPYCQV